MVQSPDNAPDPERSIHTDMSGSVHGRLYQVGSIGQFNLYTPPPPPVVVPREVPLPSSPFINRRNELSRFESILADDHDHGGPRLIAVEGEDDIGKTDLVGRWASQAHDRFPDGSVYCDLSDHARNGAVDLVAVLGAMMRSLGTAESFWPSDLAGRANHWRSLTSGKRLLVVLDNMDNPAWLPSLKPGSSESTLVMISRFNTEALLAEGAELVEVPPLNTDHGVELLSWFYGKDRTAVEVETARALVSVCGGSPAAMRRIGGRLRRAPGLKLSQIFQETSAAMHGSHSAAAEAAKQTLQDMSDDVRELFRTLSCHPGSEFSTDLAEAMHNGSNARESLQQLESAQLLVSRPGDRWRIPALGLPYSSGSSDRRDRALRRMTDWYQSAARCADMLVMDAQRLRVSQVNLNPAPFAIPLASPRAGLDWLQMELANLLAIQEHAANRGWDQDVVSIEESLWALYINRKHPGDWGDSSQRAVAAAQRLGDIAAQSRMHAQRGRYLSEQSDSCTGPAKQEQRDAALTEMHHARELARSIPHQRLEASAIEFAGRVHTKQGEHDKAIASYEFAIRVNKELAVARAVALNQHHLGAEYISTGEYNMALPLLVESLDGFTRLGSNRNRARVLIDLGTLYGSTGGLVESMKAFDDAVDQLAATGSDFYLAKAHEVRGDTLAAHGLLHKAQPSWQAALTIHENNHSTEAQRLLRKVTQDHDSGV